MKRSRNPELKKEKIIEATHKILREDGYYTNFSLDAVAKEAGVSKGGLIHHFPSKDALLTAVAQNAVSQFEARVADAQANDPQMPGAFSRAYINAVLQSDSTDYLQLSPLLLNYLESDNGRFHFWHRQTETDGIDPVTGAIVRMAIDGVIYAEMIDKRPLSPTLREQMRQRLLALLNESP